MTMGKNTTLSKDLQLFARSIADSRGRPTVEVEAKVGGFSGIGDVPAGASKGEDEAQTVSVEQALKNISEVLLPQLQKANLNLQDPQQVRRLDAGMHASAGPNFRDLGANAVLPVSRALYQLSAKINKIPLYELLRRTEPSIASDNRVLFYMNIFNGGLHALKKKDGEQLGRDRIDIQEIMVVPVSAPDYKTALETGEKIDATLKSALVEKYGAENVTRADEAGFSVKGLGDSTVAIGHVFDAIRAAGFEPGKDVKLALDVAASSFFDVATQTYLFRGQQLSTDAMINYLVGLTDQYKDMILSIEDGLGENDWSGWRKLTAALKPRHVLSIGDDLFVTQLPRLLKGIEQSSASAILIKVNQNGSVHGTLEVIKKAHEHNMKCVISHRSGETLDDSIADLAVAVGAFGLKTGDPQPVGDFPDRKTWVRRSKYLRMLAIEAQKH